MTLPHYASRVLTYPGSAIRVDGPGKDVAWLVQFLGPSFRSHRAGDAAWQVRLVRDEPRFTNRLRAGRDPRGRRRPCFFLDTRIETLPLWRGPRGAVTVFDQSHGVFAFVRKDLGEVEVLAPAVGRLSRLGFMRIVREHVLSRLMDYSGLLVHSSALVLGGKAALIVGEKRSGKSSLLLHALSGAAGKDVRFLANDRVWLSERAGESVARGFPTISSLRLSSLELFPDVAARLRESRYGPALSLRETRLRRTPRANPWNRRKFTLSPLQLCRLLEVNAAAEAEVGALLFPQVTRAPGRIRMIPLRSEQAERLLRDGLFRAGHALKAGGVFAAPGFPRRLHGDRTARRIRDISRRVPGFIVELGLGAYKDRAWMDRLKVNMTDRR